MWLPSFPPSLSVSQAFLLLAIVMEAAREKLSRLWASSVVAQKLETGAGMSSYHFLHRST